MHKVTRLITTTPAQRKALELVIGDDDVIQVSGEMLVEYLQAIPEGSTPWEEAVRLENLERVLIAAAKLTRIMLDSKEMPQVH